MMKHQTPNVTLTVLTAETNSSHKKSPKSNSTLNIVPLLPACECLALNMPNSEKQGQKNSHHKLEQMGDCKTQTKMISSGTQKRARIS